MAPRGKENRAARWRVGYVIAVIMMFSVSFFKFMVLLFPLWVAAVSIVIVLTARTADSPAPVAEPTAGV